MDHAAMAVVLRTMQWSLDDAAFQIGRGELAADSCAQLAADLERTAASVRAYTRTEHRLVIDGTSTE